MTELLAQAVAVIVGSIAIATVVRWLLRGSERWGTWRTWFEVGVVLSLVGLVALMAVGFLTAPDPSA